MTQQNTKVQGKYRNRRGADCMDSGQPMAVVHQPTVDHRPKVHHQAPRLELASAVVAHHGPLSTTQHNTMLVMTNLKDISWGHIHD